MNSEDLAAGERRQLSEAQVLALAAATWLGALAAQPVPVLVVGGVLLSGFLVRRPLVVIVAMGLAASALGHRAVEAFVPLAPTTIDQATLTVVDDPRPVAAGWRCTLRLADGTRVDAWAYGSPGFALSRATVGDSVEITGRIRPLQDSPWARSRHLRGRLGIEAAQVVAGPSGPRAFVEAVRSRVVAGADRLPEDLRPLYLGLVVGEDRFQPPEQRARFAAAGLAHLLAVSGQNVAFVLAVTRPIIERCGPRSRLVMTIVVLAVFAAATRMEPSVLRATVTAGLAASASMSGHRQSGMRLLGLAVTALLLVDPFLVHSVGFQLSISASAGILVLAPPLANRLSGPGFLVTPLSVTTAAQVAVAPLLLYRFGPVSLVAIPANLIAGWAAGAVMMWGLTVGVVAGAIGTTGGAALQLPALGALIWLDGVAAWAARVPVPAPDAVSLVALLGLAAALILLRPKRARSGRLGSLAGRAVVVAMIVVVATPTIPRPPALRMELAGGGIWMPNGEASPSVLVVTADADDRLLGELVSHRIQAADVVVVQAGTGPGLDVARSVTRLVAAGVVMAPPRHRLIGATRTVHQVDLDLGTEVLHITPVGNRLDVVIE